MVIFESYLLKKKKAKKKEKIYFDGLELKTNKNIKKKNLF